MKEKFILDACCGSRMFWWNKKHPNTIFIDNRKYDKGFIDNRLNRELHPDKIMDFRKLKFPDKSFKLVVFDPPHLVGKPDGCRMTRTYGCLNPEPESKTNIEKIKVSTKWLPRPSNKCPGCYPIGFEKMIKDLLGTENYAHLFAGLSKTGFRIDIREEVRPDLIADCQDLSMIEDNKFSGAMADPPYTEEFAKKLYGTEYPKWNKWAKEIVRIVKPGGKIGIMQNYVVPKLPKCKYVEVLVLINRIKQYPKIVTIQRKMEKTFAKKGQHEK